MLKYSKFIVALAGLLSTVPIAVVQKTPWLLVPYAIATTLVLRVPNKQGGSNAQSGGTSATGDSPTTRLR